MPDDLTAVMTSAITDAGLTIDTGVSDGGTEHSGGAETVQSEAVGRETGRSEESDTEGVVAAGTVGDTKSEPTQAEVDELAAELKELGFATPEMGKENRIPYHRAKKTFDNKARKLREEHEKALTPLKERLTVAERAEAEMARVNAEIKANPQRYIELLATLHPEYKKYLQPAPEPTKKVEAPTSALGEEPQPDHKFEDGSMGYTQETYRKLQSWQIGKAKEEAVIAARAEFEEKLKALEPIQKEYQARQTRQEQEPRIKARLDQQRAIWGDAFDADYKLANSGKSEIVAYMDAHPDVSFETATAAVLRPKLVADREKIRKETHEELNKRPAAAAKKEPSQAKAEGGLNAEPNLHDVIRQALIEKGHLSA